MMISQALTAVEEELTKLGLKDRWGDPLIGLEAVGPVANFHGDTWTKLEDSFFIEQRISPAEYVTAATVLIQQFKDARGLKKFRSRVQDMLDGLHADQVELDVFPRKR